MTPIKQGRYAFKKDSLIEIRKGIGISQSKMAELLGVPANTLSRWEIGATAPDANSLAAIYSLAKEHGMTPLFFGIRTKAGQARPLRNRLIVIWDFQTTGMHAFWVRQENTNIQAELNRRFGDMATILKAFTHPTQQDAAKELENMGWRVWEGEQEVHNDIIDQAKSDSGQNFEGTILVLITEDNSFVELIDELTAKGVQVYVMSPQLYNNKLLEKVGQRFAIPWHPMFSELPKR